MSPEKREISLGEQRVPLQCIGSGGVRPAVGVVVVEVDVRERVVDGLEDLVAEPGSDLPAFDVLHEVFLGVSGQPCGLAELTVALGCQQRLESELKSQKKLSPRLKKSRLTEKQDD